MTPYRMRSLSSVASIAFVAVVLAAATSQADPAPIAWQWDAVTPDLFPLADLVARHGDVAYRLALSARGGQLRLSNGTWSETVTGVGQGELTGAAMVVDSKRIYIATYDRIATGCVLSAYAVADGKQVWTVPLVGGGPISHSKYSNRVQLLQIDGKPVAIGDESAKRYIEVREPETGALIRNTQLDPERIEPPISEPLYRELDHILATRAHYEISVNDLLLRLARMKAADHRARRAAFEDAVRALEGVELQHGRYKLEVELGETTTDFTVKARRRE